MRKSQSDIVKSENSVVSPVDTEKDLLDNGGDELGGRHKCKWLPTSMALLKQAEEKILSYLKTPYKGEYVNVGPVVPKGKEDCKLWTLSLTEKQDSGKTPLVMLHGLGSGVALWAMNLDELAADRPVYAFDMLGFGRSSRPKFSSCPKKTEEELVESIENWRKEMKLERFALLGHSMGGYVVSSYAIKYPNRISHLILADPWGFPEKPADPYEKHPVSPFVKTILFFAQPLNPLFGIRLFGPMGPKIIERARPDLVNKFSVLCEDGENKIPDYIFHCNAQTPSGETAFHNLSSQYAWAKNPMVRRIGDLDKNVPMTIIWGGNSYIDRVPEEQLRELRPESYLDVQIMQGAGHHVNADDARIFNKLVLAAAANGDISNTLRFSAENNGS